MGQNDIKLIVPIDAQGLQHNGSSMKEALKPAPMADHALGHYYRSVTQHLETEAVSPLAASDHHIAVADLLP